LVLLRRFWQNYCKEDANICVNGFVRGKKVRPDFSSQDLSAVFVVLLIGYIEKHCGAHGHVAIVARGWRSGSIAGDTGKILCCECKQDLLCKFCLRWEKVTIRMRYAGDLQNMTVNMLDKP
jgi:hypothetical protein